MFELESKLMRFIRVGEHYVRGSLENGIWYICTKLAAAHGDFLDYYRVEDGNVYKATAQFQRIKPEEKVLVEEREVILAAISKWHLEDLTHQP